MHCESVANLMPRYLDLELPERDRAALEEHVEVCPGCRAELDKQRELWDQLGELRDRTQVDPPAELWSAIERRLPPAGQSHRQRRIISLFRRPIAAAASLTILIGTAAFLGYWLNYGAAPAEASSIDYSVLLDGLGADVDAAVQRFLDHYQAEPVTREAAESAAPKLSYKVPVELPGGYELVQAYRMRFGDAPGVAARYQRGEEPLVVFFHTPVDQEHLGTHRDSPCIVGDRHGSQVQVGRWRLIHFTDPSTCHCLLSTLDLESGVPAVMERIAPEFASVSDAPHQGHGH
ncbi:MAG: hypothetical protein AMXMBFR13_17860 [Phycisphaerae bacterium]